MIARMDPIPLIYLLIVLLIQENQAATPCVTSIGGTGDHLPTLHRYKRYARAAVMSARANAPHLIPQLIVSGLHDAQFEEWFGRMGGTVHHWNLSFYPALLDAVHQHHWHGKGFLNQYGAYLRIDIPLIIRRNLMGKVMYEHNCKRLQVVVKPCSPICFSAEKSWGRPRLRLVH